MGCVAPPTSAGFLRAAPLFGEHRHRSRVWVLFRYISVMARIVQRKSSQVDAKCEE